VLVEALGRLDAAGIEVLDVSLRRPTLDDVFLSLTGRPTEEPTGDAVPAAGAAHAGSRAGSTR
jgi:ABC-2 type transport system ATP-binding protein